MSDKVAVKTVTLLQAEAYLGRFLPRTFGTISDATDYIKAHADHYPDDGGYDKVDFSILWDDNEKYVGRLYCKHYSCAHSDTDIALHVREAMQYAIDNCGNTDQYSMVTPSTVEEAKGFLDAYSLS